MKNLNLIKRLWTDSHEKQKPQRFVRYAAMLLMLLTLGVGQMWATNYLYVTNIKAKNSSGQTMGDPWRHSDYTMWVTYDSGSSKYEGELVSGNQGAEGAIYRVEMPGSPSTVKLHRGANISSNPWNSTGAISISSGKNHITGNYQESATTANWAVYGYTVTYDGNGKDGGGSAPSDGTTYAPSTTVTVKDNVNGMTKTGYVFAGWNTANDGSGTYYAPGATFSISANTTLYAQWVHQDVLNGTKVMFYAGMSTSYNYGTTYLYSNQITGSNHGNTPVATGTASISKSLDSKTFHFSVFTLASSAYYLGEANWAPREATMSAGGTYMIHNNTISASGFTQAHPHDYSGTRIFSYDAGGTTSATTTVSSSIIEGSSISVSTASSAGVSSLNKTNTMMYFLYNGSSWSLLPVSAGSADVSALSAGSGYKIATVLCDGYIFVKADEDSFTVTDPHSWALYSNGVKVGDMTESAGVYSLDVLMSNLTLNSLCFKDGSTNYKFSDCNLHSSTTTGTAVSLTQTSGTGSWTGSPTLGKYTLHLFESSGTWKVYVTPWYSLTYSGNGESSGTAPTLNYYKSGTSVTVADNTGTLKKTGYKFDGWYTTSTGTGGTAYAAASTYTMPSNNATLYAKWTPLPIVYVLKTKSGTSTLSDFASAGSNTDIKIWAWERTSDENKNFYDKNYDNRYDAKTKGTPEYVDSEKGDTWYRFIPDANLSYFDNTKEYSVILTNGSGKFYASDEKHYVDVEELNSDTKFTGTVWIVPHGTEANSAYLYTYYPDGVWRVKYNMNGHGDQIASENVTANAPMSAPTPPTASKYAFAGWYTDPDCTSKWNFANNVTSDMTLYAKWVAVKDITVYIYNSDGCASDMDGGDLKIDATPYIGEDAQSAVSNATMTADGLWYKYTFSDISGIQDLHLHWANSGTTDADLSSHAEFNNDVYIYQATNTGTTYIIDGANDVSVSSGANGSVNPNGTLKVPVENEVDFGVSITATPSSGYTFAGWTVSGNVEIISGSTASATIAIISTGTGGTVQANFRANNLKAYIVGRLSCRTEANGAINKHVGNSKGTWVWSDYNSDKFTYMPLTWNSTTALYELHTYCTTAELSEVTGGGASDYQWLRIAESDNNGSSVARWYGTDGDKTFTDVNNSWTLQTSPSGSVRFNNSSNKRGYIVLTYSPVTHALGFRYEDSMAKIDDISLSLSTAVPGETVTATPSLSIYPSDTRVAYCWKLYSNAGCTSEVATTFTSIGEGKVNFNTPMANGTYYLKLTIHDGAGCDASVADTKTKTLTVNTTNCIFFKNVPGWTNVYVYNLGASYWNSTTGSGCKDKDGGKAMTRIGKSNVYYYRYASEPGKYIAFVDKKEDGNQWFDQCQVAYREDFSTCARMYVPENWIHDYLNYHDDNKYRTAYYSSHNSTKKRGYWTTYPRTDAGIALKLYGDASGTQISEHSFTQTAEGANTYTVDVTLDPATCNPYYFDLYACAGNNGAADAYAFYGNSGIMNVENSSNWNFYTEIARCRLTPTAAGTYKFKLLLSDDGAVQVSVDYPLANGDYRLVYSDDTHHDHPTRFIRGRANGKDTVSIWVDGKAGNAKLKVQKCTDVSSNPITWINYTWGSGESSLIDISELSAGVYNFYLEQNGSKHIDVKTDKTTRYTGLYYIRTNGVNGGWMGYNTSSDNRMTYSYYADQSSNCDFNYYKAKWINDAGSDVTFTIACDYSESLCDTLGSDDVVDDAEDLPQAANIRFGWDSKTNTPTRAYIGGSSFILDRFLVMIGDEKMLNSNGNPLTGDNRAHDKNTPPNYLGNYEMNFSDLNNWIYRCDIKAVPGAEVKLTAEYNDETQYFIGGPSSTEQIIGGDGGTARLMRVTYDFKTNRLMTAWLPDGDEIGESVTLKADMMLIRKGQEAATQITFATGKTISDIKSIYGVLQFDYNDFVGKFPNWSADNVYEYMMYYISFPFDVKVSEIFGVGTMGENWIVQKYNGAKRAQIGWFAETSTFWETMTASETMNAYEGYLLLLDRVSFNDGSNAIWYKQGSGDAIYLYFPSVSTSIGTITAADTKTITVPSHRCDIDRPFTPAGGSVEVNHKNTDSHWNVIGTPLFATANATTVVPHVGGEGRLDLNYYYAWDSDDNTLSVQTFNNTVSLKSMHSYMVQYTGDVTFTGAHIAPPSSVAARRMESGLNYQIELQLVNNEDKVSRTFVELRENACDTFLLNEDVYMMRTSNTADLYSYAGNYDVAANVLSVKNHLIPIGIDVKRAGMYRFTMPSEFSGTVTLIDNYTGARTDLSLSDREVYLNKGVLNDRFMLEINLGGMVTNIEGSEGGSVKDGGAHKFLKDGVMYILRDGAIYDARGNRVE